MQAHIYIYVLHVCLGEHFALNVLRAFATRRRRDGGTYQTCLNDDVSSTFYMHVTLFIASLISDEPFLFFKHLNTNPAI